MGSEIALSTQAICASCQPLSLEGFFQIFANYYADVARHRLPPIRIRAVRLEVRVELKGFGLLLAPEEHHAIQLMGLRVDFFGNRGFA